MTKLIAPKGMIYRSLVYPDNIWGSEIWLGRMIYPDGTEKLETINDYELIKI